MTLFHARYQNGSLRHTASARSVAFPEREDAPDG